MLFIIVKIILVLVSGFSTSVGMVAIVEYKTLLFGVIAKSVFFTGLFFTGLFAIYQIDQWQPSQQSKVPKMEYPAMPLGFGSGNIDSMAICYTIKTSKL